MKMALRTISLGKYPYTYARVSVMRSFLLGRDEYHKMLKMSLSEIISFLQTSQYKKAIDELAARHSGVELMEMALNRNLVETWQKLKKISKKEVSLLIEAYLQRADLWNLKTIMRGIHTGTKPEATATMLLPAGKLSKKELDELIKSGSVEDMLKKLGMAGIKPELMSQALEQYKAKNTLVDIENYLDRQYYGSLIEFSRKIPSEGKLFRQFLEAELEVVNTMNILRLRKAGMEKHEAAKYAIGKSAFVQSLLKAEGKEEIGKILEQKASAKAVESYLSENTLSEVELELGKNLLKRTRLLLHQHPLTVDVILGYMFAKEIEVKNLKLLLKARQLGLSNEFAEQQLVV